MSIIWLPAPSNCSWRKSYGCPVANSAMAAPAYAGDPAPPPSLEKGVTTFGSFNNAGKINSGVIALWAEVLAAVPGSNLHPEMAKLRRSHIAGAHAIRVRKARDRFAKNQIAGASRHGDMLSQYSKVDIALDPIPFAGGATTYKALWMESRL